MDFELDHASGLKLQEYLSRRPPTAAEIAREAGVTRQFVWQILNGRSRPTPRVLEACERLGVPVFALLRPPAA